MNIKVARALQQPFAGRNWAVKIAIGALITIAAAFAGAYAGALGGIIRFCLGALTAGFVVRVMQNEANSAEGLQPLLPEWNNLWDLFSRGVTLSFADAVFGTVFSVLFVLLGSVTGSLAALQAAITTSSLAPLAGTGFLFLFVMLVLGVAVALTVGMLNVHYAAEDRFGAFLDFRTAWRRLLAHPGNTLLACLISLVVFGAAAVLALVPFVGAAIGGFVAQLAIGNLWAQVYRLGR